MENKTTNINGPVNVIRLEGELSGVKKSVYLFGDFHLETCKQTECDDLYSLDFHKYLAYKFDSLKKNKIKYDLFFETRIEHQRNVSNKKYVHDKYIDQTDKLFAKNSKHLTQKFKINNDYHDSRFENARFHFMDIRDLFDNDIIFYSDQYDFFSNNPSDSVLNNWSNLYIMIDIKKDILNEIIHKKKVNKKNRNENLEKQYNTISNSETMKEFEYYVKKLIDIKNDKLHNFIKDKLNFIIKTYSLILNKINKIKDMIEELGFLYDQKTQYTLVKYNDMINFKMYINKIDKKYEFDSIFYKIQRDVLCINVLYTDLYLMRRLLDKKYVEHSLIYTGFHHTLNYVFFLVKYFNFKITHAYYHSKELTKELHNQIKKIDEEEFLIDFDEKHILLKELFYPPELIQCIDLKGFPNDFL